MGAIPGEGHNCEPSPTQTSATWSECLGFEDLSNVTVSWDPLQGFMYFFSVGLFICLLVCLSKPNHSEKEGLE